MPIASIQQPDSRSRRTKAGSAKLSARGIADPLDRQPPRDQLVAERAERLDVQRHGVGPQVEEGHAEPPVALLDVVDDGPGAALADLVALMDGGDAEVARVRTAARGFHDDVRTADDRHPVQVATDEIPGRKRASRKPLNLPCTRCGTIRPARRKVSEGI